MEPLQTPVVPAIIKSTLTAPTNGNFHLAHLKMLRILRQFGGRQLGAAGGTRTAGNPAGGICLRGFFSCDNNPNITPSISRKPQGAPATAPGDSQSRFPRQDVPQPWDGARHRRDPALDSGLARKELLVTDVGTHHFCHPLPL